MTFFQGASKLNFLPKLNGINKTPTKTINNETWKWKISLIIKNIMDSAKKHVAIWKLNIPSYPSIKFVELIIKTQKVMVKIISILTGSKPLKIGVWKLKSGFTGSKETQR